MLRRIPGDSSTSGNTIAGRFVGVSPVGRQQNCFPAIDYVQRVLLLRDDTQCPECLSLELVSLQTELYFKNSQCAHLYLSNLAKVYVNRNYKAILSFATSF